MARPKKQPHEKRDQRYNLRFTSAEMAHVQLQAAKAGLNLHDYARKRILGAPVAITSSYRTDPALISELNRIGVNLNQLARAVNMDREFEGDWGQLAIELRRVLTLLMARDGS